MSCSSVVENTKPLSNCHRCYKVGRQWTRPRKLMGQGHRNQHYHLWLLHWGPAPAFQKTSPTSALLPRLTACTFCRLPCLQQARSAEAERPGRKPLQAHPILYFLWMPSFQKHPKIPNYKNPNLWFATWLFHLCLGRWSPTLWSYF